MKFVVKLKGIVFAAIAPCVSSAFSAPVATTAIPASAYVQRGLVDHYDGIENAGVLSHDSAATTWKDLVGSYDLKDFNASVTWTDNAFVPPQADYSYAARNTSLTQTKFLTIDACIGAGPTMEHGWCVLGCGSRTFSWYPNGISVASAKAYTYPVAVLDTRTVNANYVYNSTTVNSCYIDAVPVSNPITVSPPLDVGGYFQIGRSVNAWWSSRGKTYGVRLYNRALDPWEILLNYDLDQVRFVGTEPTALTWPEGWRASGSDVQCHVTACALTQTDIAANNQLSFAGGTAAASIDGWKTLGVATTIRPVADANHKFLGWSGDVAGLAVAADGTITLDEHPRTLNCHFVKTAATGVVRTWTGSANNGQWSTAGNWSPAAVPAAGDVVTIGAGASVTCSVQTAKLSALVLDGATLVFKEPSRCLASACVAELRADGVSLGNGAKMTHVRESESVAEWTADGKGAWKVDGRVAISCVNLTVDVTSKIDGDGLGYYCHSKEGGTGAANVCGPTSYGTTGNGAHGGYGGYVYPDRTNLSIIPCSPYDDPVHPIEAGGSGSQGNAASCVGLSGGGIVRIAATGEVLINGTVSVNAQQGGGNSVKAGAGGSVWISCKTIRGSGSVTAKGSMNTDNSNSADLCGGGGCIAIHYDSTAQAAIAVPDLVISSGHFYRTSSRGSGDVGTIYLTDSRLLREVYNATRGVGSGRLILGNWNGWAPASLSLDNVWLRFPSDVCQNWHLTGGISVSGMYGRLDFGGETFYMDRRGIIPLYSAKTVNVIVDGDVTLDNKGRLSVFAAATNGLAETWATLDIRGNLSVGTGAVMELFSHNTNGASCKVLCKDLSVASGGSISADAHGFCGCVNGAAKRSCGPGGSGNGSGGSYGGYSRLNNPYGEVSAPKFAGSGGGYGDFGQNGSEAGGLVYIVASGDCTMNGTVSANGQGQLGASSGTGSGGGIYITAKTFAGTGGFTANGGNGQQDTNAGAGGRIALVCTDAAAQAALASPAVYSFDARTYGGATGVKQVYSDFGTLYLNDARMASDSLAANKILHCELHLADWSGFAMGDLMQTNTYVRLAGSPSLSCSSVSLNNARFGIGGGGTYRRYASKRPYCNGRAGGLTVAGDVTLVSNSWFVVRGGITNGNVGTINLDVAKTNSNSKLSENLMLTADLKIGGALSIATNCFLKPESHPFHGGSVRMNVRDLDIALGGAIDASSAGWATAQSGESAGYGPGRGSGNGRAAGYGGKADDGKVYGYAKLPTLPGSGAGRNNGSEAGGTGGGLVWLTVERQFNLLGSIKANGEKGNGTFGSGGSGGAIYLKAIGLNCGPNALLSAEGGGSNGGAGDGRRGGGGRIAVYTRDGTVPAGLKMSVKYGQDSHTNTPVGWDGTIHVGRFSRGFSFIFKR